MNNRSLAAAVIMILTIGTYAAFAQTPALAANGRLLCRRPTGCKGSKVEGFRAPLTFSRRLSSALGLRPTWSREPAAFAARCCWSFEQKLALRSSPYPLR